MELLRAAQRNRGEFYDQEEYEGGGILVRYVWLNLSQSPREWSSLLSRRRKDMEGELDLRIHTPAQPVEPRPGASFMKQVWTELQKPANVTIA